MNAPRRIFVEPNAHHHLNAGDAAMLQVAVARLEALWPDAVVEVLTDAPERLALLAPHARPVPASGRALWFSGNYVGARVHRALPAPAARGLTAAEAALRRGCPGAARGLVAGKRRLKGQRSDELERFLDAARHSDVLIVTGAGALADPFAPLALTILELVEDAARRGATTAMLGQGLGPMQDPALRAAARRVLPRIDLLALREGRSGPGLARELGVAPDRVVVTGDDAVEPAYARRNRGGREDGLGLSLRVARYSGLSRESAGRLRGAVEAAAASRGVAVVPIPISRVGKEDDAGLLGGGAELHGVEALADAARRCRVVVTGSYHAGVFALAQGVPVIGLAAVPYYTDKFLGLEHQFPGGCTVVRVDEPGALAALELAIDVAWASAGEQRDGLLESARAQVAAGKAAYGRVGDIASARR